MRLGLSFDLRNPSRWFRPWPEFYRGSLELMAEADDVGIDVLKFPEHHLFPDGYIPQGLTFMAAAAVRTSRVRLATGPLLAPLHGAVDIAERAAVVDCMSGGRVELAFGAGARPREFELFGVELSERFRRFEKTIRDVRRLLDEGGITPAPMQQPVPMWAAVTGPRGSRLAGELGLGLYYLETRHWDEYLAGLEAGGHSRDEARLCGSQSLFLAEDPERAFASLGERIEHDRYTYAAVIAEARAGGPAPRRLSTEELWQRMESRRAAGLAGSSRGTDATVEHFIHIMTPEDAADHIRSVTAGRPPVDTLFIAGTVAGALGELAHDNVRLAATKLKPLLEQ